MYILSPPTHFQRFKDGVNRQMAATYKPTSAVSLTKYIPLISQRAFSTNASCVVLPLHLLVDLREEKSTVHIRYSWDLKKLQARFNIYVQSDRNKPAYNHYTWCDKNATIKSWVVLFWLVCRNVQFSAIRTNHPTRTSSIITKDNDRCFHNGSWLVQN